MLESLNNYRQISNKLHSSAQPTIDDFKMIKKTGVEIIINLARVDSPDAIINEAQVVEENGLHYVHIPVDFKRPDTSDLERFFNTMEQYKDKTTLVHCAYNWRVSCFIYLYRIIKQGCNVEPAKQDMLAVWQPDKTWQDFIDNCLSNQELLE